MVEVNFFLTCSPILDLVHFSQVIFLPIVLQIMPQLSGPVNSIWWLGFSFYLFFHSGLRAFFTDDFANCTSVYAKPSGAVHSIWWLGLFFFDLFSCSELRAFCTNDFANCTTNYASALKITPTIRCCEQHLMVGVNFFLTSAPILDLGHFSQVILPIVLLIMPQLSGAVHSIWWLAFSFYLFSHSGLRAFFTDDFANCTTVYAQPSGAVHSIWWLGLFFFTYSPILDLGHFSQMILPIVLLIMPPPKNNPNYQVLFTASDGWG